MHRLASFLIVAAAVSRGNPARSDDAIPADTLKSIKAATVFVKVKVEGEEFRGSGFVVKGDGDAAYVITNNHVIAPELVELVAQWGSRFGPPSQRAPRLHVVVRPAKGAEVTLVFASGAQNEQVLKAEVMAADPDIDLALLKVRGVKNLPHPVDCKKEVAITETMPLYSFGFPFGEALSAGEGNPAVTVGKASISSLRNDDAGELALVQIDGTLNPGNSGGPLVDARGHLIGVAVAIIRGSRNIGLAIPATKVPSMWEGHLGQPHLTLSQGFDDVALMTATVELFDPFHKLKTVSLSFLSADQLAGKPKPTERLKGMRGCHDLVLKIDGTMAIGSVPLKKGLREIRVAYQGESVDSSGRRQVTYNAEQVLRLPSTAFSRPLRGPGPGVTPYSPPKYKVTDPLSAPADFVTVADDLKSADFSRRVRAEMRLIHAEPSGQHPEMARALEQVLAVDTNEVIRSQAAWALEKWGTAASLPALEKAAKSDSSAAVRSRAGVTVETIKQGK